MAEKIAPFKTRAAEELAALLPLRHALGLDQIVVQVSLPVPLAPAPPVSPLVSEEPLQNRRTPAPAAFASLAPPFGDAPSVPNRRPSFYDIQDVSRRLERGLNERGGACWRVLAKPLLAALLADVTPVFAGEQSHAFWATIADVLAAGRCLPVFVTPGSREPLDVFGRLTNNVFYPHAHRLADLALSASDQNDLSLIVLENVSALDWEAVIAPVLAARDVRRALPLLHPHVESGAYKGLSSLAWPASLLIGATWTPSCFPPPPSLFRQAIVLTPSEPATQQEIGNTPLVLSESWTGAEWRSVAAMARAEGDDDVKAARSEIEAYPATPAPTLTVLRFFRALCALTASDKARALTRRHALLPPLVAQSAAPETLQSVGDGVTPADTAVLQRLFFGHGG